MNGTLSPACTAADTGDSVRESATATSAAAAGRHKADPRLQKYPSGSRSLGHATSAALPRRCLLEQPDRDQYRRPANIHLSAQRNTEGKEFLCSYLPHGSSDSRSVYAFDAIFGSTVPCQNPRAIEARGFIHSVFGW